MVNPIVIPISHDVVSKEAILKTCYWFSRDFFCDVETSDRTVVILKPKTNPSLSVDEIRASFISQAMDFSLRDQITAKTGEIRDLLLAKAFSESGVLEDQPEGSFEDSVEEEKADSMFKILSKL